MLILYNNKSSVVHLKKMCKLFKIKRFSQLNKKELLKIINFIKSVKFIQTFLRSKLMKDNICPITFDTLNYPFISIKNYSIFRYYSLDGILNYYNYSKDYRDPFTKEKLSSKKIQEINNLAKFYKKKPINTVNTIYTQKRTELLTILCCLNDIVNNIINTQNLTEDYVYNFAIPQMMTYVYYIIIRYRNQTRNIVQHFIDLIERHDDNRKYNIINYFIGILINENL